MLPASHPPHENHGFFPIGVSQPSMRPPPAFFVPAPWLKLSALLFLFPFLESTAHTFNKVESLFLFPCFSEISPYTSLAEIASVKSMAPLRRSSTFFSFLRRTPQEELFYAHLFFVESTFFTCQGIFFASY